MNEIPNEDQIRCEISSERLEVSTSISNKTQIVISALKRNGDKKVVESDAIAVSMPGESDPIIHKGTPEDESIKNIRDII